MASNTRSHMCVKIMVMGVLPWLGVFIRRGCSFYIPIAGWNAKLFQCTVKCCLQKPLRKGLNIDFSVLCDVGKSEKSSLFGFQAHEIWKTIKNSCLFNQAEYEYEINYFGKCFALDLCKGWMEFCFRIFERPKTMKFQYSNEFDWKLLNGGSSAHSSALILINKQFKSFYSKPWCWGLVKLSIWGGYCQWA